MGNDDFPKEVEAIIYGTGLVESIVSAALSRIGITVLHLDPSDNYGGTWKSVGIISASKLSENTARNDTGSELPLFKNVSCPRPVIRRARRESETIADADVTFTKPAGIDLAKFDRRFNIDISPKLIFCRSLCVETMISSDISRYCEFRLATRLVHFDNGNFKKVPCSRSDVFSSKEFSVIEKRLLMRFLQSCLEDEAFAQECKEHGNQTFEQFLTHKSLPKSLAAYIQDTLVMGDSTTPLHEGVERLKKFLKALNRFGNGNSAFLFPMYGIGELPQCFCRMSAVFGGVFCLQHPISEFVLNEINTQVTAVKNDKGEEFSCKWVIANSSLVSSKYLPNLKDLRYTARAVAVLNRSIVPCDSDELSVCYIPPSEHTKHRTFYLLELPPSSQTCCEGTYLLHLTCYDCSEPAEEVFSSFLNQFTESSNTSDTVKVRKQSSDDSPREEQQKDNSPHEEQQKDDSSQVKPNLLWVLYFNVADTTTVDLTGHGIENLILTNSSPPDGIDFDAAFSEAERVFRRICPDKEYLPKPPKPEDIILDFPDSEGAQATSENAIVTDNDKDSSEPNDNKDVDIYIHKKDADANATCKSLPTETAEPIDQTVDYDGQIVDPTCSDKRIHVHLD